MFHCHVLYYVTSDGAEPDGLVALVKVTEKGHQTPEACEASGVYPPEEEASTAWLRFY